MELAFDSTFDISAYGSKLFKADPIQLGTTWEIPGVKAATSEGKEIEKMVKGLWAKEMDAFKKEKEKEKEKEYKEILVHTERALYATAQKKAPELMKGGNRKATEAALMKWLDEEAKGVNVMIRNALTTFKGVAEKKMNELWDKIAQAIDRKFKTTLRNAKIVAALKITGLAIVILVAAALTIAASVLGALWRRRPTSAWLPASAWRSAASRRCVGQDLRHLILEQAESQDGRGELEEERRGAEGSARVRGEEAAQDEPGRLAWAEGQSQALLCQHQGQARRRGGVDQVDLGVDGDHAARRRKGGHAEIAIEQKLQGLEKQLAAEQDKKKAAELKKLRDAGIKKIFDSRLARENNRLYLRPYTALTTEGATLLAAQEKLTSAALGAFLVKLNDLANSKEMDTLTSVGQVGADFLKALISFKAELGPIKRLAGAHPKGPSAAGRPGRGAIHRGRWRRQRRR